MEDEEASSTRSFQAKTRKQNVRTEVKAGLTFPVTRISNWIKSQIADTTLRTDAAVYLVSILQQVMEDIILEAAKRRKRREKVLCVKHIYEHIFTVPEYARIFEEATFNIDNHKKKRKSESEAISGSSVKKKQKKTRKKDDVLQPQDVS